MKAGEIRVQEPAAGGKLSLRQDKMLEMLREFHSTVTSEEVRSVNPILEKYGFSTMLSTIMKNAGLFEKGKTIRWIHQGDPTPEMAVRLDRYYQLYPKIVQSKTEFQSYFESPDPYPIPLNKIWQFLEFEQYNNAKRSLLKNCEEGKDYTVLFNEAKTGEKGSGEQDREIFKLSRTGFQLFLLTAQKPMAKLFARLMIEVMNQRQEFYLKVNEGVSSLSEKANLLVDLQVSIRCLQVLHKKLQGDVLSICCDPAQLALGFEKDATRRAVIEAFDQARDLAVRRFTAEGPMPTIGQISLP
jgi:hypothetical protein